MKITLKKFLYILLIAFVSSSCDSEDGLNCFQAAGDIVQNEVTVLPFTKILVWERTQLFITEGPVQKVVVETGSNLMNDIDLQVVEGRLNIYNYNGCNLVRDYGITKVYVTSPNITEIRSSSGLPVESIGTLRYPNLTLLSEDRENEDLYHTDGDFRLDLDSNHISIVANGLSNFYLTGKVATADFGLFASACSVRAENLEIQFLQIFHRSTAPMIVRPIQSIKGKILSIGDVISKNRPPIVEVEQPYRGRLIFE